MNRVEELRDRRDRCGDKPLAENIIQRITMKCLPSTVVKPIAVALDEAQTFRQVRRLVVKQMHNVVIDMMDGDRSESLYIMQDQEMNNDKKNNAQKENKKRMKARTGRRDAQHVYSEAKREESRNAGRVLMMTTQTKTSRWHAV